MVRQFIKDSVSERGREKPLFQLLRCCKYTGHFNTYCCATVSLTSVWIACLSFSIHFAPISATVHYLFSGLWEGTVSKSFSLKFESSDITKCVSDHLRDTCCLITVIIERVPYKENQPTLTNTKQTNKQTKYI